HGRRLNDRCQLGFGIPLIGYRRLLGHDISSGTKLLLPVVQSRLGDPDFLAQAGHRAVMRRHQFPDGLFFEFRAVTGHFFTPTAPSNLNEKRADIYCDRGGLQYTVFLYSIVQPCSAPPSKEGAAFQIARLDSSNTNELR